MNRSLVVVVVVVAITVACKPSTTTPGDPAASATASSPVAVPAPTVSTEPIVPADPVGLVQVSIPRWLAMLRAGLDGDFLRDAALTEETEKLLEHQSISELVNDFEAKRHATVVKTLEGVAAARAPAAVTTDGTRTVVRFRMAGGGDATFVVDDGHVRVKGLYGR
jgi:hypothetical protein